MFHLRMLHQWSGYKTCPIRCKRVPVEVLVGWRQTPFTLRTIEAAAGVAAGVTAGSLHTQGLGKLASARAVSTYDGSDNEW